jgi:hypothetical protein
VDIQQASQDSAVPTNHTGGTQLAATSAHLRAGGGVGRQPKQVLRQLLLLLRAALPDLAALVLALRGSQQGSTQSVLS